MSNLGERLVYLTAGPQVSTEMQKYPHCSVPCPNLHSSVPLLDLSALAFFKEYPYRATYPMPIGQPADVDRAVLNGRDPSLELCKLKRRWHIMKKLALKSCKEKHLPDLGQKEIEVHSSMAKLLQVVKKDPDEHFDASYNSYYTGGNISCDVTLGGKKFLCCPDALNNKTIDLHPLIVGSDKPPGTENFHRTSVRLKQAEKSAIFQLIAYNDVVLTRQRNTCVLFKLGECEQIDANIMHVAKHKQAFYSCGYDPVKNASYYLSADWVVSVRDVESEKETKVTNLPCVADLWGYVRCHDQNVLMLSNRTGVHLLDLRESPRARLNRAWEIKDVTDECEELYISSDSNNDHVYIVTSHQLLGLDLRKGWNQRWTHGISEGPGLLSISPQESGSESIFIGSLLVGDVVHVENYWDDSKTCRIGTVPPYCLPSLTETLHRSNNLNLCLSPLVQSRFGMAVTGLCSYVDGENIHIIRRTSAGDVFHQKLFKKFGDGNIVDLCHDDISHLQQWEKSCDNLFVQSMPKVPLCGQAPVDQLEKIFTLVKESRECAETITPGKVGVSNSSDTKRQHWKYSKKQLAEYKDCLASKILGVWKIEEDEWSSSGSVEQDEEEFEVDLEDSGEEGDNRIERIINWLQKVPSENEVVDGLIREDIARLTDNPTSFIQTVKQDHTPGSIDDSASTNADESEKSVRTLDEPDILQPHSGGSQMPVAKTQDSNVQLEKRKFVAGF